MPAAKRKAADRVAATRALFIGLLGVAGAALIGLGIYFSTGGGHSAIPLEDTDYEIIENADRPRQNGPIEVVEFFSYGCIHCKNFDPDFEAWASTAAADVRVSRQPASFFASWSLLGQAYLALEHANALEVNHQRMFNAIHNAGRRFTTSSEIADYLDSSDFAASDFMRAFDSASVRRKLSRATDDTRRYQINAVPTLVVAGRYRVSMRNGTRRALEVADWLIEQERNRMAAAG